MTDCALAVPTPAARETARPRHALPRGIPRWAWLFGVAVVRLTAVDDAARPAWVVSAGAGTTHTAALVFDHRDDD